MNLRSLSPLFGVLALTLASCTAGSDGIFASIEKEKKVVHTGNLSTTATVTHMTEFNDKYYATGGRALFVRDTSSTTWSSVTSVAPASTVTHYFTAVGSTGTTNATTDTPPAGADPYLYAIANTGETSTNALYYSGDGTNWYKVDLGSYTPSALVPVRNNDGQTSDEVLVTSSGYDHVWILTVATDPSQSLAASAINLANATAQTTSGTVDAPGANPITAAAKTSASGTHTGYYFANESFVFSSYNPAGANLAAVTLGSGYKGFTGVLYLATTASSVPAGLYLTTKSKSDTGGGLYRLAGTISTGSTASTVTTLISDKTLSGYPVSFDQMLLSTSGLWIGTGPGTTTSGYEGYGYANYNSSDGFSIDPPDGTDSSNFTSSDLNTYAIPLLYKAPTAGDYFIGTSAHGLWRWASSSWEQQ